MLNDYSNHDQETRNEPDPTTLFAAAIARVAIRAAAPSCVAILTALAVAVVFIVSSTTIRTNSFDPVNERSILERYAIALDQNEHAPGRDILFVIEPRPGEAISLDAVDSLYQALQDSQLLAPKPFAIDPARVEREPEAFFSQNELDDAAKLATVAAQLARQDPQPLLLNSVVEELTNSNDLDAKFAFAKALDDVMRNPNPTRDNIANPTANGVEARTPQALQNAKRLLAQDGALAIIRAVPVTDANDDDRAILAEINAITQRFSEERPQLSVVATGAIPLQQLDLNAALRVSAIFGAAFLLAAFFLTWATFARISRALVVTANTLVATICALGIYAVSGATVNPNLAFGALAVATLALSASATYLAQYSAVRVEERSVSAAILETSNAVANPIAITAAVAFLIGVILAICSPEMRAPGLLILIGAPVAWLATIAVIPTLLQLLDGPRPLKAQGTRVDLTQYFGPVTRRARATVALATLAALGAAYALAQTQFLPTRARFIPRNAPEMAALERATKALGFNPALYATIRVESNEEARALRQRLQEDQTLVVFDPNDAAPARSSEREIKLTAIRDALSSLQTALPDTPAPRYETLDEPLQKLAAASKDDDAEPLILDALERAALLQPRERDARLALLQRVYAVETLKRLFRLRDLLAAAEFEETQKNERAEPNELEITVCSTRDLERAANLAAFVDNLTSVTPRVTGVAPRAWQRLQINNIARLAAVAGAFALLFASVWYAARSFRVALAVVAPTLAAYLATLGVAALLKLPLSAETIAITALAMILAADAARRARDGDRATAASPIVAGTLALAFVAALQSPEPGWREFARLGVIAAALEFLAVAIVIPSALRLAATKELELENAERDETSANAAN